MKRKIKKRFKRITAFMLVWLVAASNVNIGGAGTAMAAVMTAEEAEDTVTVTHELVSGGKEAEITIYEATPDILITDVRMVRGKSVVAATGSNAIKATSSEVVRPEEDKTEEPETATPSEPEIWDPDGLPPASPSEPQPPQTPAKPDQEEAGTEKPDDSAKPDQEEAGTEKPDDAAKPDKEEAGTEKPDDSAKPDQEEAGTEKPDDAAKPDKEEAVTEKPDDTAKPGKEEAVTEKQDDAAKPDKEEAGTEKPDDSAKPDKEEAVTEKPDDSAKPDKEEAGTEKPDDSAKPDQEAPPPEKPDDSAKPDKEEDTPVLELAQGDTTWRFLVNENRTYRFKITYQTIEENRLVKKTVSVDYEVDDILDIMPLNDELLTITSNIHGEGKEEGLELPVDRDVTGTLVVSYKIPNNVKGRRIVIEFPKRVKVVRYPNTAPLDGNKTRLTTRDVDGVTVYTLTAAILDDVTEDIQFQVDYESKVTYALTEKEREDYASAEGLTFGSIRAEAFAGSTSLGEAEIGPLTAKMNTGENIFGLVRAGSSIPDELVNCIADNYKLESQKISHNGIWDMRYEANAIYEGAVPVLLKHLKIYAPRHFRYDVSQSSAEYQFFELGEDDMGHYLIYNFQTRDSASKFREFWYRLRYMLAEGESVEGGQVYLPPKAPELTYLCAGKELVREEPMMSSITISDRPYTVADQVKMTVPESVDFWAGGIAGRGISEFTIGLDNRAEKGDPAAIMPKYSLEDAKLTVQFPEGIYVDVSRVENSDILAMALTPGDDVVGPTGDEKIVSVKMAEARLSDGTTASMKVWQQSSTGTPSGTRQNWVGRLENYGSIDPQTYITGYSIEFDSLYRAVCNVTLKEVQAAVSKEDGTSYPLYGEEPETVTMDVRLDYEGGSKTGSSKMNIQKILEQDWLQVNAELPKSDAAVGQTIGDSNGVLASVVENRTGETSKYSKIPVLPESAMEQEVLTITLPEEISVTEGSGQLIRAAATLDAATLYTGSLPGYQPPKAAIRKIEALLSDGSYREIDTVSGILTGELAPGEAIRGYRIEFEKLYRAKYQFYLYRLKMAETKADGTPFPTDDASLETVSITSEVSYKGETKTGTADFKVKGIPMEERLEMYCTVGLSTSMIVFQPAKDWALPMYVSSGEQLFYIRNTGRWNNGNYIVPSHHGEGMEWSIEYPLGVNPVSWRINPVAEGDSVLTEYKPEADIEKVLLYLDNGDIIEAPLIRSSEGGLTEVWIDAETVIPKGRYVIKATIFIRKLFNARYGLVTWGTVPVFKSDGIRFESESGQLYSEVRHGATFRRKGISYRITPFESRPFRVVTSPPHANVLLQQSADAGYLGFEFPSSGTQLELNPTLEFEGEDLLNSMTGVIQVPNRWEQTGWKIEYETSFGNSGTFEIPTTGYTHGATSTFAVLADGEHFTKLRVKYDGLWYYKSESIGQAKFVLKATAKARDNLPRDPENANMVLINGSYVSSGDISGQPDDWKGNISIKLPHRTSVTLKGADMGTAISGDGFQGTVLNVALKPQYKFGFPELPNQFKSFLFGSETYYVEWLGGNDFVVEENAASNYKYSMVKSADGKTFVRISLKTAGLKFYEAPSFYYFNPTEGYDNVYTAVVPLSIKILPGTSVGSHSLLGKVYVDLKEYQERADEVEQLSGIRVKLDGAVADSQGICQDGDTTSGRLLLLSDSEKAANVRLNNITGTKVMLGINGVYQKERLKFSPDQRRGLNALYSVSSEQDQLKDYEMVISIPAEGKDVAFRTNDGGIQSRTSQFNMKLKGPVATGSGVSGIQISYQLGSGDYISENEVRGRWSEVTSVRVFLPVFSLAEGGKPSMNLMLDLEAEEKNVDTLLEAYIAPRISYKTSDGTKFDGVYGELGTFVHGNHEIRGVVWNDRNENGIRETGEPLMKDVGLELWNDKEKLSETKTNASGAYVLETNRSDKLYVKLLVPGNSSSGGTMVLTKPLADESSDETNSDFIRPADGDLSYGTVRFPDSQMVSKTSVDAGLCYLPEVTAQDLDIKSGLSSQAQAEVTVKYGTKPAIQFAQAQDTQVAMVSASGLVTATGDQGDMTTAKAWVVNSLGDRVEAEYAIRIFSNNIPVITAHDWNLVEGDQVSDWWSDVECVDPEDTWQPLSIMSANEDMVKQVTFHREASAGEDSRMEPSEALAVPGTSYVRYSAIDTDGNEGTAIVKLTVYGKLEARVSASHHMVTEDRTLEPEENQFYYLEKAGGERVYVPTSQVTVSPAEASLRMAGEKQVTFTADHPKQAVLTTGGVTVGDGRRRTIKDTYQIDSRPVITGAADRTALPGEALELLGGTISASYDHYDVSGKVSRPAAVTVTDPEGHEIEGGHYTAPDDPGSYTLTYQAKTGESYENGENTSEQTIQLLVCGTVEVEAPEILYLTPEEAGNQAAVWNRLKPDVKAWYNDPVTGEQMILPESALKHTIRNSAAGKAETVEVKAEYILAGTAIESLPKTTTVVIRQVPQVAALPDVQLRKGAEFDPKAGVSLTAVDPEGKNTWSVIGHADVETVGRYKLIYRAEDPLTGAHADTIRWIYVHGNPSVTAENGTLSTHLSAGEEALFTVIRPTVQASIQYVKMDGTIETVEVTSDKLHYEIKPEEHYAVKTAGTYKVTVTLDDGAYIPSYIPAPFESVRAECQAEVVVSDKIYEVKFSINNDTAYHKGEFADGAGEFDTSAVHGKTMVSVPVPTAMEGYHFDGYKTLEAFTVTEDVTLGDGTVIPAGDTIPVGTMLSQEQAAGLKLSSNARFQAYFSATPVIEGQNIKLYTGETYKRSALGIKVTDPDDNANAPTVDDGHVNTSKAGTYQVKVSTADSDGNQAEIFVYVQVVGKTSIIATPDLHIRKGTELSAVQLLEGVKAVYEKPLDIPEEPWPDADKSNNGQAAVNTEVPVRTDDTVDTDQIRKTEIPVTAPGMVPGREEAGKADGRRAVYIHGLPVILAYDNGLYTHQSTGAPALEAVVRTGAGGTVQRDAASAYVEYVLPDGSTTQVTIAPEEISYQAQAYKPLTEGDYTVMVTADDSSVLSHAQAPALVPAVGSKAVKLVVADKMYEVTFEFGEHGGLANPSEAVTTVAHGKTVRPPELAPEEGYELNYWMDESGNKVNLSDVPITDNRNFKAVFKIQEFTVRFIGKRDRVIKTEIVLYGQDATPPEDDRDVTNNRFDGWSTSYQNIKSDKDIYTTYWKQWSGGPNGGGGYVPSGPGAGSGEADHTPETEEITDPSERLSEIGEDLIPKGGERGTPAGTPQLPTAGELSDDPEAGIGYQATLIEGTTPLAEDAPLAGGQDDGPAQVYAVADSRKKCILHLLLVLIGALEGIYLILKCRKDKKELEQLRKQQEGKEESGV